MTFESIVERKLIVEVLASGERRELLIRIGRPVFKPKEDYYECPVDYGWLVDATPDSEPTSIFRYGRGVDPVHALLRALDMIRGLGLLNDWFRFYLPNGLLFFDGKYELSRWMHRLCEEYAQERKKDEYLTIERFQYTRIINEYEAAIKGYKEMLERNDLM